MSSPSDVAKAIEAQAMMAAASCAFNAGVVGVGKPLTVAEKKQEIEQPNPKQTPNPNQKPNPKPNEKPNPKMRTGPTVGPRKAAKVSDIF